MCGREQCADAADVEEKWTATGPREAQKGRLWDFELASYNVTKKNINSDSVTLKNR